MRKGTGNRARRNHALGALAAAGFSVWAGLPAARGDFIVTPYNLGDTTIGGITYTTYVFTAEGDNTSGTLLESGDVVVDTAPSAAGSIGVDVEHSNVGTGAAAKYSANVDGSLMPGDVGIPPGPGPMASQALQQSVFGDPGAGTFGGFGYDVYAGFGAAAGFDPIDITDNSFVSDGISSVYVNTQTSTYGLGIDGGTPARYFDGRLKTGALPMLDPAFENPGNTVNPGSILNGATLYSLETRFVVFDENVFPLSAADPDPFFQVVIQQGVPFTLSGQLVLNNATETFSISLPEPSAIGLLMPGGIGLLRRRHKWKQI